METILDLVIGSADVSGGSRMTGLRHGFEMLIRRPILGVGPGCYPLARKAWFGWSLWAHNHYGELMGDLGIIGTVVWFKFLIAYLRRTLTHAKLPGGLELVPAIMTAILVATIVRLVVGMGSHSVYIFFWYMLAAIVIVVVRIDRSVTKEATDSPDNALESSRASET
jgi:O-antigen ligase